MIYGIRETFIISGFPFCSFNSPVTELVTSECHALFGKWYKQLFHQELMKLPKIIIHHSAWTADHVSNTFWDGPSGWLVPAKQKTHLLGAWNSNFPDFFFKQTKPWRPNKLFGKLGITMMVWCMDLLADHKTYRSNLWVPSIFRLKANIAQ